MEFVLLLAGLVLLGVAARRNGADSREGVNSEEWQRRAAWPVN